MDGQQAERIDERLVSRRGFLAAIVWGLGSLMAASILAPFTAYAVSPALKRGAGSWTEVGKLSKVPEGAPTRMEYTARIVDGWITQEKRLSVWVVRQGTEVVAFSPACTHLGCAYNWNAATNRFECPCHNGLFAKDGIVLGGPPPRPLDRYETKVQDGKLYVGHLLGREV